MDIRKYVLAVTVIYGLLGPLMAGAQPAGGVDSLLKKADRLFITEPAAGIAIAAGARQLALKMNLPPKQIKALNLLAYFSYRQKDYLKGCLYADSAVRIAKRERIDSLAGDALVTLGNIRIARHEFDQAINHFQDAINYYREKPMISRRAAAYLNLGMCEHELGRFERAGKFYISAAEIYRQLHDEPSLADTYNAIGSCFTSAGNYPQAIFYHHKALLLRERMKDRHDIAQSCNNLGYVLLLSRRPDAAIRYLSRTVTIRRTDPDSSRLVLALQNLGSAWQMKGDLRLAKAFIGRSLMIARSYRMDEECARGEIDMAEVILAGGQPELSLQFIGPAILTAARLRMPELLMTAYASRVRIAVQMKDFYTAFSYTKRAEKIKDSLTSAAKLKTINELEISFQTKQRKRDIAALTLKNRLEQRVNAQQRRSVILTTGASCLLLVLLTGLIIVYYQKVKASRHVQTLHQELHHRVKNNLQILSGLFTLQIDSLNDETAKAALRENESRLLAMNLIHHKLYQDRSTTTINMEEYLTSLARQLKDSFGEQDTRHIELECTITPLVMEADKAVAVGLIVNELLTNEFKYFGKQPGKITLSLQLKNTREAVLLLFDDRPGWEQATVNDQPSFGLKIVSLMARQLETRLEQERPGLTSYRLVIRL